MIAIKHTHGISWWWWIAKLITMVHGIVNSISRSVVQVVLKERQYHCWVLDPFFSLNSSILPWWTVIPDNNKHYQKLYYENTLKFFFTTYEPLTFHRLTPNEICIMHNSCANRNGTTVKIQWNGPNENIMKHYSWSFHMPWKWDFIGFSQLFHCD